MHLASEHAGCSDDVRTALLMYGSQSTSQSVTRCCPICLAIFAAVGELNSHIARHLERFSLFSLPRSAEEDADDVDQPDSNKPNCPWNTSRDGDTDEMLNFTGTSESSQPPPHGAMADLELSTPYSKEALEVTPEDHPDRGFESDTAMEPEQEDDGGMESEDGELSDRISEELNFGNSLTDRIFVELRLGNSLTDDRKFLPAGRLVELFTKTSVREGLRFSRLWLEEGDLSESDIDDLVDFIVPHARKIFATLLCTGFEDHKLYKAMQDFRISQITDSFLPITKAKEKEVPFFVDKRRPWTETKVASFCDWQWTFLAPELPPKGPLLKVDACTRLPFIHAERVEEDFYGDVYKVVPCPSNIREESLKVRNLEIIYSSGLGVAGGVSSPDVGSQPIP